MNNEFERFTKESAGEYLRAIVTYKDDDYTLEYVRDDIDNRATEGRFRLVFLELLEEKSRPERVEQTFGQEYGITHLFPNLFLVHIPEDCPNCEGKGAVISLDREAGRDLGRFIEECTMRL